MPWPYVAAIPSADLFGHRWIAEIVERVYRDDTNSYDHVLIPTTKDVCLAIVVNLREDRILGHHLLDLNEACGLATRH
ncbi:MAG: hypothetical protein ABL996_25875 [Micropepsaceae bacterium]